MTEREKFEYEAGAALNLPTSIIELARKGDGYDHAYDSMNIMQPLNQWYHWWKKATASTQEQTAALAAENASFKSKVNDIVFMDDDSFFSSSQKAQIVMGALVSIQTPATDAFIAEQQAIGVEKFATVLGLEYQQLKPVSFQAKARKSMILRAVSFAEQLRDEVKS